MPFERFRPTHLDALKRDSITPHLTRWEGMKASYNLAAESTLRNLFFNSDIPDRDSSDMVDAGYLNEIYPDLEKSFTGPVSREFAQYVIERDMKRKRLASLQAASPDDALQWVLGTAAAMSASMVDPYETGLSIAGGFALGTGVKLFRAGQAAKLANAGRATAIQRTQDLTRMQQAGRAAAYNTAGAVAVEPALFIGTSRLQEERTLGEAFMSVAASAVVGTALEMSFKAGGGILKDVKSGRLMTKIQTKYGAASLGKNPNLDTIPKIPDANQIQIQPRAKVGDPTIKGKDSTMGSLQGGTLKPVEGGFVSAEGKFYTALTGGMSPNAVSREAGFAGGNTFFTRVAHFLSDASATTRDLLPVKGKKTIQSMEQADLSGATIIDGNLPLSKQHPIIKRAMEKLKVKDQDITLKEFLDSVPTKRQNRVEEVFTKYFFDTPKHEMADGFSIRDTIDGKEIDTVVLFNHKAAKTESVYDVPNQPVFAKNPTAQSVKDSLSDPSKEYFHDPQSRADMEQLPNKPRPETKEPEVVFDEGEISAISSREDLNPIVKKRVEQYNALKSEAEDINSVIKSAIHCGGR